ncbi:MAG: hypothetical protein JO050_07240, partial [Acidimicrobiia bacterium]|nr:hypothetical protein [Acidimicrobiia bacterium]
MTTVPIGNVRWAHVPGGAASYQVAGPLWVRPWGAVPAPGDSEVGAGFGAGFAGAEIDLTGVARRVVVGGAAVNRWATG